jgi:anhydro-N-acetylmuramic acid kinase
MPGSRYVVGLMSGTSLDGIDAVLLRMRGSGTSTGLRQIAHVHHPFPPGLRRMLLRNSLPATSRVDEIARLNLLLAQLSARAVGHVARRGRVPLRSIALIGSHGQTIHHLPRPTRMFGHEVRATFQIGDPSAIAALTRITTVGDFRVADMALGGEGAPLVPYVDWLLFRSASKNRILLNIGGIANITVLPRNCPVGEVRAFDTGPGNMLVDLLMRQFYGRSYDRDGRTANSGMVSLELLGRMARHRYLRLSPPKSTGREEFGAEYLRSLLGSATGYARRDIVATVAEFTPFAVYDGYRRFVEKRVKVDEVIVSGGGARNGYFLEGLRRYFSNARVRTVEECGMASEAKEAICFAVLANETMAGHPSNIPGVTGASRAVLLGKICPGAGGTPARSRVFP